jgi:hypothetical protein
MPLFACAALAIALQDPQTDLNPATAFARPAAAPKAQQDPVQEPQPQEPVASGEGAATGLDSLDEGLLDFEREYQAGWNVDVSGYLKFAFIGSNARRVVANSDRLRGLSVTAARMWVDAEVEGWQLRFGLRGERHSGLGYLGLTGEVQDLRLFELVAKREFSENVNLQIGRIRTPFLQSALYDDNQLMFFERTFQGEDWDAFSNGATLNVRIGDLEGFLGVHNGIDNFGSSVALTARGLWHVTGDRGGMHINEGPFDAPEDFALTVGGAAFFDTETDDVSAQAIEAYASWRPVYFSGELVDKGEGLGDLYSWGVTAAVLLGDSFTVQGRIENFDRDDGTDVYRIGFTHYLEGHDIKWHVEYADAESNAPLANLGTVMVGAQFSF